MRNHDVGQKSKELTEGGVAEIVKSLKIEYCLDIIDKELKKLPDRREKILDMYVEKVGNEIVEVEVVIEFKYLGSFFKENS